MVKIIFALAILILGLLEVTVLQIFKVFHLMPDLLLIAVVTASLTLDFKTAFILSVFAGLFKDTFSANPFGINTVLFALWSFAIARLSKKISLDYDIIRLVLFSVIAIIHNIISAIVIFYSGALVPPGLVLRIVIIGSAYTAAVFPLLFKMNLALRKWAASIRLVLP
ncbi:MAG: rod shape-determining protein MreD [Omnitrophica WOR_2 bacterium RBG_13_44_8b]|nr:MAG: rod shape-determining protein MreD [Omnitrophica WOR_2 bacterium RBG_13_44_8b]